MAKIFFPSTNYFIPAGSCLANQFTCANGNCTSKSERCNGVDDCGDNTDEQNCATTPATIATSRATTTDTTTASTTPIIAGKLS